MGAGKTALGAILAERLGVPFLDSDDEIEKAAAASIAEIFERDGEPFFRQKEAQVISRLLEGTPAILSVGGGAYMSDEIRDRISKSGFAVWLDVPFDVLWQRVKGGSSRPLLQGPDPQGTLQKLADTRAPIYATAEMRVISSQGIAKEAMVDRLLNALLEHPQSGLTED